MFAGNNRRSSNVKVMQLFHEMKQQFPTIPDHLVTSSITSYIQSNSKQKNIVDFIEKTLADYNTAQMGRSSQQLESPPLDVSSTIQADVSKTAILNTGQTEMDETLSGDKQNSENVDTKAFCKTIAKRPNYLNIEGDKSEAKKTFNIQLSEKCKDVHKLLSSELSEKPPRSPQSTKQSTIKSPLKLEQPLELQGQHNTELVGNIKKETCSTPTQTTDTLIGNQNVNLSLNVNCSVDVVQSPTQPKRTTALQVTPSQPWLQVPTSPRSFTSVNLTLRPPTSSAQSNPIDITSQNSSLTYSTSSYDSQKGLQSRLQITVGPSNGSVSSLRVRPKSYHPQEHHQQMVSVRAGSLNNLSVNTDPPLALKQQARIERLRIELNSEKAKLLIMNEEIQELEKSRLESEKNAEIEKYLIKEIKHLRFQCNDLELDGEAFYNNIYTGQGINEFSIPIPRLRQNPRRRLQHQLQPTSPPKFEGPKWNCQLCTFLNHPILDKCEQCDFPRILHGTKKAETINPNITVGTLRMLNNIDIGRTSRSLSLNNVPREQATRPIGFVINQENDQQPSISMPTQINTSHSAPSMLNTIFINKNQV
ncbi:TGF-beta-activated kinase 1 and MAP3K7-binding protein 2 isoform X1 [Diabrotica virgifera virgifera]|uniref:RanBP2-type domain-containing protein n=1 Tax=Diabrotica virgifera virgifera TaxID=50390 RepID=A0ABM5I9K9_DIAVI|nr:TGF-beta-activated kinase 1 and MAP3K7-binding protein 2 isoform X1 [Diabrotica virgifera virgifera]XP_028128057.2 TGF-beta-activated kinase 1 and MAP3K7-binding protein 2 isoform X1 [Diabrotica virgifera virgifera]